MEKPRLLRITTVPISLHLLLNGQLSFMQSNGFDVLTASAEGPEIAHLRSRDIPHNVIPLTRRITPLRDLWCVFLLVRLIRKFKPHIVHTHTPKAGLLGMVAAWLCRVPVRMHTVAGIPYQEARGPRRALLRWAERVTYLAAHHIYPNSTGLRQFMELEFPDLKSKFKVLGNGSSNGVNPEFFQPTPQLATQAAAIRKQLNFNENDWVACFVGRVVRDKGIGELVEAFSQLASEHANVHLFLVGHPEDDLDPLPQATTDLLLKSKSVVRPGFQEDIRPWIMASNVLILPSYREGFPNVLLQAAAMEKPCIATNINGCNEIIVNGETGLLVPAKNASALGEAMRWCYRNQNDAAKMGMNARTHVMNQFSQSYIWYELLKEYRQLVPLDDQTLPG